MVAAGVLASVRHLKAGDAERSPLQEGATRLKRLLSYVGLSVKHTPDHLRARFASSPRDACHRRAVRNVIAPFLAGE